MTRETKIGLLVGLAFIIVVGILLSEHLTTTTERPAAPLAEAGDTVRNGMAAPGVSMHEAAPPVRVPEPAMPVPVARDLAPQPQPTLPSHVAIGPGSNPAQPPIVIDNRTPIVPVPESFGQAPQTPAGGVVTTQDQWSALQTGHKPIVIDPFANQPPHPVAPIASLQGEQLVPVQPNNTNALPIVINTPGASNANPQPTMAANNVREYKAQPGDSLSRIAALLPGGNTKANREAVIKLNPSLQKDPNKVIADRVYLLPIDKSQPSAVPAPLVEQPSPIVRSTETTTPAPPAPAATQFRTYIVKKGDSLTKIAVEQLGSKNEVGTIRKLNEDVLKGGDLIKIDMKLKLPVKSVASSN